jgi:hypothetical protein
MGARSPSSSGTMGVHPWRGTLHKTNVEPIELTVLDSAAATAAAQPGASPRTWPLTLHLRERVAVGSVLRGYDAAPRGAAGVWRLAPAGPPDRSGFAALLAYLQAKQRAGVVQLPPLPGRAMLPRVLYLLTPSREVCTHLRVSVPAAGSGGEEPLLLVAIVMPSTE